MIRDESVSFRRSVPLRHDFVAGGGPAGVAAAAAAARAGRSVFLAEEQSCLGGMGTAGMVPAFMTFGDGENVLAAGIGEEILETLRARGGTGPDSGLSIRAETLKRVYDDLLAAAGVEFTLHAQMIAVEAEGGRVASAILAGKSGLFAVRARVFVDGTGDGDLAAWAGAPFEKGDEEGRMMPGTLCQLWAGVDWERARASKLSARELLPAAIEAGLFTVEDLHLPGMWRVGRGLGGGNIGHTFGVDGTDERSLTAALIWGRKYVAEYEKYYKEYLEGFEDMELVATGSLLGIRETRRITGDYVLNLGDFKARAVFDDEIGRYCYPVDIHPVTPSKETYEQFEREFRKDYRYGKGESYGIPYRTLTPRGLDNVLVAGRCISADRYVQGSVRTMPGCYITGQAAGVAACLSAETGTGVHDLDVSEIQRRLAALGACLPNFEGAASNA